MIKRPNPSPSPADAFKLYQKLVSPQPNISPSPAADEKSSAATGRSKPVYLLENLTTFLRLRFMRVFFFLGFLKLLAIHTFVSHDHDIAVIFILPRDSSKMSLFNKAGWRIHDQEMRQLFCRNLTGICLSFHGLSKYSDDFKPRISTVFFQTWHGRTGARTPSYRDA